MTNTYTPEPVLKVSDVAAHLDMHHSGVYELVKSGELRSVRVGRLIRIPASALDDFLSGTTGTTGSDDSAA